MGGYIFIFSIFSREERERLYIPLQQHSRENKAVTYLEILNLEAIFLQLARGSDRVLQGNLYFLFSIFFIDFFFGGGRGMLFSLFYVLRNLVWERFLLFFFSLLILFYVDFLFFSFFSLAPPSCLSFFLVFRWQILIGINFMLCLSIFKFKLPITTGLRMRYRQEKSENEACLVGSK